MLVLPSGHQLARRLLPGCQHLQSQWPSQRPRHHAGCHLHRHLRQVSLCKPHSRVSTHARVPASIRLNLGVLQKTGTLHPCASSISESMDEHDLATKEELKKAAQVGMPAALQ